MLAGILYSLYESSRRRIWWSLTLDDPWADGVRVYRQELERLRDLHRASWRIFLPASLPGAAIVLAWAVWERGRVDGWVVAVAAVVWIVVMLRHEAQEARRFQRELDALQRNDASQTTSDVSPLER